MKLPHADHAVIDIAKLRDYSLSHLHPEGKHKARVFVSSLGFTAADAETLRNMILSAILTEEAVEGITDEHGRRYVVDFATEGLRGIVNIRTVDNRPRRNRAEISKLLRKEELTPMDEIKILDVVAVTEDIPKHGLRRGEVGTVVERWKDGAYEVEFSDDSGEAYAFAALPAEQLMKLHFRREEAA